MAEKKKVCLLAGSEQTRAALEKQLIERLEADVKVTSAALDSGLIAIPKADVFAISSKELREELQQKGLLPSHAPCVICARTLNLDQIEQVIRIPKGTEVLFVNDTKQSAQNCVRDLLEVELDHIRYLPWYPGKKEPVTQEYAVTAGETQLVPKGVKHVIDLGPRIIDVTSLLKILEAAGSADEQGKGIIRPYVSKIIEISKKMAMINTETEVLKTILREKLEAKGHIASYDFDHILGVSSKLKEAKERAAKLAVTDLTVLIEGESGTGKELFAAAIHNGSLRRSGPYLAVNFSALPEELLESELFGYEEGAFTGAKKGGRVGLFQQADGGTIFLDEIGDITPRMQTKLLRVIQEKEVMPVGGTTIRQIDVRIISATNKDLRQMVEQGQFRADLYYRLKMGYLYVPPLRDRKGDIEPLVRYFAKENSNQTVDVEDEVLRIFQNYSWKGNTREVANTVQYMLAVRKQPDRLSTADLPDDKYFEMLEGERLPAQNHSDPSGEMIVDLGEDCLAVLQAIQKLRKRFGYAGRNRISVLLREEGYGFSAGQIRNRLEDLERKGYVVSHRGKKGTVLTEKGNAAISDER